MGITSQNHLGLGITTISNIEHESYTIQTSHQTSSTGLPGLLLCWSQNYITALFLGLSCNKSCSNACFFFCFFFRGLSGTKSCSNACFFFQGLSCTKSCSNACFFSRFVEHQIVLQCVLFFRGLLCTKSCSNACFFFQGLSCTKSCSNACFFSRFVEHQIVLQCVLFFRGLLCTKSCSNACVFPVYRAPNRVLLCGSWPGVSFGKLLLVVFLQRLQFLIFHEGIDYW